MSRYSSRMDWSGTALLFPKDGKGAASAQIVASVAGTTTYTATTVADSAPWSLASVTAGMYAFNPSTGMWGIVQSVSGTTATIDEWRLPGTMKKTRGFVPTGNIPTTATQCIIHDQCVIGSYDKVVIDSLLINPGAIGNVAITNQVGTVIAGLTFAATAAGPGYEINFGSRGVLLNHPFGIKPSDAGFTGTVAFRGIS